MSKQRLRREPKQARATIRRERFLDAADRLFAELGYESVSMTLVAKQADASIGALYDYFPDKPSLALALLARYTDGLDEHWAAVLSRSAPQKDGDFAERFVNGILDYVRERPGYLSLLGAPVAFSRTSSARQPLRTTIVRALQAMNSQLEADRALLAANVIVELLRGLLSLYKGAIARERGLIVLEFKKVLRLYLTEALRGGA
jgi:AcrR family transcriptional regulator